MGMPTNSLRINELAEQDRIKNEVYNAALNAIHNQDYLNLPILLKKIGEYDEQGWFIWDKLSRLFDHDRLAANGIVLKFEKHPLFRGDVSKTAGRQHSRMMKSIEIGLLLERAKRDTHGLAARAREAVRKQLNEFHSDRKLDADWKFFCNWRKVKIKFYESGFRESLSKEANKVLEAASSAQDINHAHQLLKRSQANNLRVLILEE